MDNKGSVEEPIVFPSYKYVENSFDGIDPDRILFEKKIMFLMIADKLSCHGFLGSQKERNFKIPQITRQNVAAFLEDIKVTEYIDYVNSIMQNGIIKKINYDDILSDNKKNIYKNNLTEILNIIKNYLVEKYDEEKGNTFFNESFSHYNSSFLQLKAKIESIHDKFDNDDKKILLNKFLDYMVPLIDEEISKDALFNSKKDENEYIKFTMSFDSHYQFYKINEQKYIEFLSCHTLLDDYSFSFTPVDNYDFLNAFSENVKQAIIAKIITDYNYESNKEVNEKYGGHIKTLDDLVDVVFIIENPPVFIKQSDKNYHKKHINKMIEYLRDFGYNENKLKIGKYKMKVEFYINE